MEPNRPLTAEEEAAKRNTDCVYFLASPLTCKKAKLLESGSVSVETFGVRVIGSTHITRMRKLGIPHGEDVLLDYDGNGCEFRHSEGARINPRDCWYWLNGSCMNPKCSFRHPPLNGLFETPMAPLGPAPPILQASTQVPAAPVPGAHNQNKQTVPCHFFQKGQCLKGDRCPFMHGPHPSGNHVAQLVMSGPPPIGNHNTQPVTKVSMSTQQNILKPSIAKPVQVLPPPTKPSVKTQNVLNNELPTRSQLIVAPVSSESTPSWPRPGNSLPVEERHQNGRELGECLRESSPGFDVLVDDDVGDSDYYNDEEHKRASVHNGRNPVHSVNDFDYNRSDLDGDRFNGKQEYERYARDRNQHGRDHRRASLERMDQPLVPRRRPHRESSPSEMDGADLRQQLLKKRRLNGLRSGVGLDRHDESRRRDDHYVADGHRGRSYGGDRRRHPQDNRVGSRLQGRITLPPSSSPDRPIQSRLDRDGDGGRHRAKSINDQGRPNDETRRRPNEDSTADPLNFASPKSLAELKGVKNSEQPTKCIDPPLAAGYRASEGPKLLSNILKVKREGPPVNGTVSSSREEHDVTDADVVVASGSASHEVIAEEGEFTEDTIIVRNEEDEVEDEEEEGLMRPEGREQLLYVGQTSAEGAADEMDDVQLPADGLENQELEENYENYEDEYETAENAYQDEDVVYGENEEEVEEDDEDDFAKRVGVFFS